MANMSWVNIFHQMEVDIYYIFHNIYIVFICIYTMYLYLYLLLLSSYILLSLIIIIIIYVYPIHQVSLRSSQSKYTYLLS